MARKQKNTVVATENAAVVDENVTVTSPAPEGWSEIDTSTELSAAEVADLDTDTAPVQEAPAADEVHEAEASTDAVEEDQATESFDDVLQSFSDEDATEMVHEIARSLNDREDFEHSKNSENANIQRTLKKARNEIVTKAAARVLLATNTDPDFMNRMTHDGSRYNVYAIGKVSDIVKGLAGVGPIANAINLACMKSLFACRAAGIEFTGELAKAACSAQIRVDQKVRDVLIRHTVAPTTAPTQASSTMQALETLGVVEVVGSRKHPTYRVIDNATTRKLEELLAA